MLPTAIECTHCGYDFPSKNSDGRASQSGFAYSPLADVALIVSMIAASIGACAAAIAAVAGLYHGQFLNGLVLYPIACLLQIGMLVVFLRVQQ